MGAMCNGSGCGGPTEEALKEMNKKGIYTPKQIASTVGNEWTSVNTEGGKKVSKKEKKFFCFFLFFLKFFERIFFFFINRFVSFLFSLLSFLHFSSLKNTTTSFIIIISFWEYNTQKNDALSVVEKSALLSLRDDDDDIDKSDFISFFEDERVRTFYEYKSCEWIH